MKKSQGFTLIELLVTISILATLVSLAAPSVAGLVQSGNVASAVNAFLADTRQARSEAIRRGATVSICRSNDPEAAAPTCSTGATTGWETGWLIYENRDADADYSAGDRLLRVQPPLSGVYAITSADARFNFTPLGRQTVNLANLTFGDATIPAARQRKICISSTGRARIAGDGNASC